ncbi:MAG: hypothetical protein QOD41_639, partial [Cryptosporangiaceae bacterium]|nr:hypothetical protein [Cryptosporangiaceae bacterium]
MTQTIVPPGGHPAAHPAAALEAGATTANRGLLSREEDLKALDRLLTTARTGAGGSLVLRGESGIGRTALLEYAIARAADMRVARLAGTEAELGLGYAGLHRLLMPFMAPLDRLPGPQRDALHAAFGLIPADSAAPFLAGLAALALLTEAAADQPLLVAVDDAQWLDEATTGVLAFVARRLTTEPIAFVIAVREPTSRCQPFDGLPGFALAGLPERHAHELLASVVAGALDPRVAQRIVTETRGNPLALVEFGAQLTDGERAAGTLGPQPLPVSRPLSRRLLRRVRTLPAPTQTLLLLAAAEPSGCQDLLRRAADRLGLAAEVAAPAEAAGLLANTDEVTFRHPLIRSAVYYGAPPRDRRRVHAALAAAADADADPDGRAWHLAAAASGPDEDAASELANSAARARARGDHPIEAMFMTRAAELTPDQGRRVDRLLGGAAAELSAGAPARAEALLEQAGPPMAGQAARARVARLRATVSLARGRFREAPAALLRAAQQLHATEPEQASRTLLDALYAGLVAGGPASTETLLGIVRTLRTWEVTALSPPTTTDLILDGFAARLTAGYPAAAPILRAAVTRLVTGDPALDTAPSLLTMGCWAAGDLLDGQAQRALLARLTGPSTSDASGGLESGDIAALGPVGVPGQYDLVAQAWRGREADARPAVTEHIRTSIEAGAGLGATTAQYAMAILELGMGRYGAALTSALSVYRDDPPHLGTHVLPELVEAAVRSGNRNAATAALERLTVRALASRTQLAAGLLARSRALSADSAEAESRYHEAIEHLREPAGAAQLARTHLVYGEWLRRQRRRRDA